MRLIGRSPFGYGPESVHHPSRPICKFIGKPPLVAKGSVGRGWESLKVCDPVVGSVCGLFVGDVSGPGIVEGFDGSKPCAMAVTALVRQVATEFLSAALFSCDHRAVHHVFGPLWCSLHPFDQPAGMLTPARVLLRMQKDIASKFERDDLVHVVHAALDVLKVADPHVVVHRVFHQPCPCTRANPLI